MASKKPGLYANIHAKQERIAHGSGEKMRKPGSEGAPTAEAFRQSEKTAKHPASSKSGGKAGSKTSGKSTSRSGKAGK
ncbi:MAG: hypothetical protein Q7T87_16525 [Polaromonas sp.]|nr:hypothetical protein [Polaromonas sp.]